MSLTSVHATIEHLSSYLELQTTHVILVSIGQLCLIDCTYSYF